MKSSGYHSVEELRERDHRAREIAQTVFDRPIVIEAGAGTGKTTILTGRIVAWCMGPGWEREMEELGLCKGGGKNKSEPDPDLIAQRVLDGVVAITFTDAAAAEMAQRVAEAFSDIERGDVPMGVILDAIPGSMEERRKRARALLAGLDHMAIETIHAFSLRLLSQFPLEAGLHLNLTVDGDGTLLEEIVTKVVEAKLIDAHSLTGEPSFLALAEKGIGPQEIVDALKFFAERAIPPQVFQRDPFAEPAIRDLILSLLENMRGIRDIEGDGVQVKVDRSGQTKLVLQAMDETISQAKGMEDDFRTWIKGFLESLKGIWSDNQLKRLKDWGRGKFNQREIDCFGQRVGEICQRARRLVRIIENLMAMDLELMGHAIKVMIPLLEEVYREMRRRGVESFNALLRDALNLLAGNPWVRDRVRRGTDQLLVDEFQDTDRLQCEIIRMIALEGPDGERRTGEKGKDSWPGLFCVGDPKQSIYGWRSADLQAYEDFLASVIRQGGEVHSLMVNFRSVPTILQEVERVIGPVMKRKEGIQPDFIPLIPCPDKEDGRGFYQDRWNPVEYWISWKWNDGDDDPPWKATKAVEASEIEAKALAEDILRLHRDQGVAWKEIGVLFRNTGDLDIYLQQFRERGVPYSVQRDRSYYRRREIIDASALVSSIIDPSDHLALITIMRSAMIGVPDAAIIPLWTRSFLDIVTGLRDYDDELLRRIRSIIEEVESLVYSDVPGIERIKGWGKNLIYAMENLAVLRRSFRSDPADIFVEKLRGLFLLEPTEGARFLGSYRIANLERFFQLLVDSMEEGGGDPQKVLRRLRRAIEEAREEDEGPLKDALDDAVQVMTIHRAKGLDFEHVYIVQMHKKTSGDERARQDVGEWDGCTEFVLFGVPTPRFYEVRKKREEVERAELVRTLYVAMTRAKERLVMAGRWDEDSPSTDYDDPKDYIDLVKRRSAPKPPLWKTMKSLAEMGKDYHMDEGSVRWVFPGIEREEDGGFFKGTIKGEMELPEAPTILLHAISLEREREEARRRMERPIYSPVSYEAQKESIEPFSKGGFDFPEGMDRWLLPISPEARREVSMAVGSSFHRAIESLNLDADPELEFKRLKEEIEGFLIQRLNSEFLDPAMKRYRFLLKRFQNGNLMKRLRYIKEGIIARELPVIIPPPDEREGPIGFYTGKIDLLYRDTDTGEYVIVDYKTDQVETEPEVAERSRIYSTQGRMYTEAIRGALGLEENPRFELWFLNADRIVVIH